MSNHTPRKRIPTAQQPIKISTRRSKFGLKSLILGAAVVGLLTAAWSWLEAVKVSGGLSGWWVGEGGVADLVGVVGVF